MTDQLRILNEWMLTIYVVRASLKLSATSACPSAGRVHKTAQTQLDQLLQYCCSDVKNTVAHAQNANIK